MRPRRCVSAFSLEQQTIIIIISIAMAQAPDDPSVEVVQRLLGLYKHRLKAVERKCEFGHFHFEEITDVELEARPQVLLIGQYSTGKTSMVRWLTGVESPFFDIRPQPSTDKFMAVVHGDQERVINGDAATCLNVLPYRGLSKYGAAFLSKFQALVEPAEILRRITFVDTPGVLSGDKQRISRNYEFAKVCEWMAQRSDLIFLLFDAHKLDISDEFREVIETLKTNGDKVRCVLNKADQIDAENLVRVYGALMWNLGKILRTPEVVRVYVGSFWDQEYNFKEHMRLFDQDKRDLMSELQDLPRNAAVRKVNEMVARIRLVKVHYCVVTALRRRASFWCRRRRQRWLVDNVQDIFAEVLKEHKDLSSGDMPEMEHFRQKLSVFEDWSQLPRYDPKVVSELDNLVQVEIPKLMEHLGGVSESSLSRGPGRTSPSSRMGEEEAAPMRLGKGGGSSSTSVIGFLLVLLVGILLGCFIVLPILLNSYTPKGELTGGGTMQKGLGQIVMLYNEKVEPLLASLLLGPSSPSVNYSGNPSVGSEL